MNKKLGPALGAYTVLMAVAAYLLQGKVLAIVLIVLAALLAKTLIAFQQEKLRAAEEASQVPDPPLES